MKKRKVIVLTNLIPHYRLAFLNFLSESVDLTVIHFGTPLNSNEILFTQKIVKKVSFYGFTFIYTSLYKLLNLSDVVILDFDFRVINHLFIAKFFYRKFKLIIWTIGVSASYKKKFDSDIKKDWIRYFFFRKSNALIFYSDYPIKKYLLNGFDKNKLFVAHNTVDSKIRIAINKSKKHFLFVGTLYKEKGIIDLLNAYRIALVEKHNLPPLIIIGAGNEKINIEKIIYENNLIDHVFMKGAIYEADLLQEYYKDAICMISPGQAGLSVLSSFSLGVPFVTTNDAITGGERLNIKNGVNGFLYSDNSDLVKIILLLSENVNLVQTLSFNAQEFYYENRTIKSMVKGFQDSINYVTISPNAIN
jgi:glycosyltransferase involved in cell wall biosynthesis